MQKGATVNPAENQRNRMHSGRCQWNLVQLSVMRQRNRGPNMGAMKADCEAPGLGERFDLRAPDRPSRKGQLCAPG